MTKKFESRYSRDTTEDEMPDEKKIEVKRDGDKNAILPFKALTESMADRFEVAPKELLDTVRAVCFKDGAATDGQLMMLLSFAKNYDLNPLAKECYAFVSKGRMSVGVQVDGWSKIANRQDNYDGQEIEYEHAANGDLIAITSKTYVKGRSKPTVYRALLREWYRADSDVWKSMPSHQLYIKARNEGIRFAFGIPAYDPDDLERIGDRPAIETTATVVAGASVNSDGAGTAHSPQGSTMADAARTDTGKSADAAPSAMVSAQEAGNPRQAGNVAPDSLSAEQTSAVAPPVAENAAASAEQPKAHPPADGAASPPAERPKKAENARKKLDKLIAEHVTSARLNLMLGQTGAASVDALNDEQVAAMIAKIESRKGK